MFQTQHVVKKNWPSVCSSKNLKRSHTSGTESRKEPRVLTCIEHWIPLFAAKQMGVNRPLLFSILPPGKPFEHAWWGDQCAFKRMNLQHGTNSFLPTCEQKAGHKKQRAWFEHFLPVTSFAAGIAASRSGASPVALGVARIFPCKTPHMFIWVGSPHRAVVRKTVTWEREETGHKSTSVYFMIQLRSASQFLKMWLITTVSERPLISQRFTMVSITTASLQQPVQICILVLQTACLFTTIKRLHQQSIGQLAESPNPPYGRKVYWNPKTGCWLLSLLESLCVCSVKSRIEQKEREGERNCCLLCDPMRNHSNWATGHWGGCVRVPGLMGLWPSCSSDLSPHADSKQHKNQRIFLITSE